MLSYSQGPRVPLLQATISGRLRETAQRFPSNLALASRHQGIRLNWRELDSQVDEWATGLLGMGLSPGDRVGIWSTNCMEWILLQLACARAGLVLVNVNPAYRSYELGYVVRKSQMKALFLWESDARANYREILEDSQIDNRDLKVVFFGEGFSWKQRREVIHAGEPHHVVNIQYTSGTTGSPKGVLLTHHNILNNGLLIGNRMNVSADDRICLPVPLYHCFGCVIGVMTSVAHGCAMILPSATFDPLASLRAIHEEQATVLYGVPTMFIAQLDHAEFPKFNLASLRTGVMAGAPCPTELMRRVVEKMHCHQITIGYGQTECSPIATMSNVTDPLEMRVSTIGSTMPETENKIVDPTTGETVPVGVQGEFCTRGYLVMKGYDMEEAATRAAVDSEGWLHTGDLAIMCPDGNFKITGRAKDMIIRGGENIYPREIEEFLYTHPKIADAQVFGIPDARLGETVAAWVRLRAGKMMTAGELCEFCKGKIAHFKVPQHIRFVDSFPMTVTGKIQKFKMRESEIKKMGLQNQAGP